MTVEETVFARELNTLFDNDCKHKKDFLINYAWTIPKEQRTELLKSKYETCMTFARRELSYDNIANAYRAMHCAELLKEEPLISESRGMVFEQTLWNKKYDEGNKIAATLNSDVKKNIAVDVIKLNCQNGRYHDAERLSEIYAPELIEQIRGIADAFSVYASTIEKGHSK